MSRRTALTAFGLSAGAVAIGSVPASGRPTAASPVVHSDRRVTFTLSAPGAYFVSVSGSWQTSSAPPTPPPPQEMAKGSNDTWTITVGPLKPNFYTYNFLVGSERTPDPLNRNGRPNSVLTAFLVPGPETTFFTAHDVPRGTVQTLTYHSAVTRTDRNATVWTPPGYTGRESKPYPTFYLVHGGDDDYLDWIFQGRANIVLDNLLAAGKLVPMVVVMPDANIPGATGLPQIDSFPKEILDSLVPALEQHYHVDREPEQRALAGLSRGGLQVWNLLLTRPGEMTYIGDFSAGYAVPTLDALVTEHADLLSNPRINAETRMHRVYLGDGTDVVYKDNVATREAFDRFGIHYEFSEYLFSGHSWETWRVNLNDFAPRLFR